MTKLQRIQTFIVGLITFIAGFLFVVFPDGASETVLTFLMVSLVFYGLKTLIYYFNMARFMVNGRLILYKGLILLDFGLFSGALLDVPNIYILLYLALLHAFSGLVEILRALEGKRYGAKSWKLKFSHGVVNIIIALCCVFFFKQEVTVGIVYGLGLLYSSAIRMITAFRRTSMAYYQ